MKRIYNVFILTLIYLFTSNVYSQVTIWEENFTYPNGTTQGSGIPPKWTRDVSNCNLLNNQDYFEVRGNRIQGRDLKGEAILFTQSINISGYSNVSLSVDISSGNGMENSDYLNVYYALNGGAETPFTTNGLNTGNLGNLQATEAGLSGNNVSIIVRVNNNSGNERHYIDNILVEGFLVVAPVADFVANYTTPNLGQMVQFTDLSTETPDTWSWSFSPSSISYIGGTNANSQNPQVAFTASGLYTVELTASNIGGSDTETKTDYIFVQDCSIATFPYSQQFDNGGLIPNCWQNIDNSGSGKVWEFNNPGSRFIYTTSSANGFAIFDSDNYGQNTGAEDCDLISPVFDFTSEATVIVSFEHFFFSGYGGAAEFLYTIDGGLNWVSVNSWSASSTPNATQVVYDLSTSLAGQSSVMFNWNWTGDWSWWWAIDDVYITNQTIPTNPPVADFVADDTTPLIGQTVAFTDLSSESPDSWSWVISPGTYTYVGGTDASSQNPQVQFTAPGIYNVELTASNVLGSDTELKLGYISINCTVSTFPWIEQFDNSGVIPSCWQNFDNSGNGKLWEFDNPGGRNINTSSSGNGFAIFDSDNYGFNTGAEDCDLISPLFDLSSESIAYLQFEHYFFSGFGGAGNISYSIDGGNNWIILDSWAANSTNNATTEVYNLSASCAGQSQVMFKWNWTGDYSWWWAVDDVILTNQAISTGFWTGLVNTDWNTIGNWDDNIIPHIASDVRIPGGCPNYPIVNEVASCKNLIIQDGGEITLDTGSDLTVGGYISNGEGVSGTFRMDGGNCTVASDYYSEIGSLTDINAGTWSFDNWFQNLNFVWGKGTINLSGGIINASGAIVWSNFDIVGTIDGPVTLNIGGTFRNSSDDWTITDGTFNFLGNDGPGPFYIMASSWGAGNYFKTPNMIVNCPEGVIYNTNPPTSVAGGQVIGDLTVNSGFLNTEGNPGFMNDLFTVAGDLNIGSLGEVTANVTSGFNVAGDANLVADHNRIASFIDNGNTNVVGPANVEQYITSERWHLVSPPVTGATIFTYLDIYLKEFNEPTDDWTYLVQPTSIPMNPSQGYSAWASDAFTGSKTVTYTGVLNTGDFNVSTVNYTPASGSAGWNLVGNPYPSGLTWDNTWATTDITPWACIHNTGNDGCYNSETGVQWPNDGDFPAGSVSPTQGFWVRATSAAASITIPNSGRIHNSQTYIKIKK
ncbi:MAG: PKD domain-containing protein [Bacteroidales bacterium]|nr:PKD domain-containing protein [Bacteroidales bacterium]